MSVVCNDCPRSLKEPLQDPTREKFDPAEDLPGASPDLAKMDLRLRTPRSTPSRGRPSPGVVNKVVLYDKQTAGIEQLAESVTAWQNDVDELEQKQLKLQQDQMSLLHDQIHILKDQLGDMQKVFETFKGDVYSQLSDLQDVVGVEADAHSSLRLELAQKIEVEINQMAQDLATASEEADAALRSDLAQQMKSTVETQAQLRGELAEHASNVLALSQSYDAKHAAHDDRHAAITAKMEEGLQRVLESTHDKLQKELTDLKSGHAGDLLKILADVTQQTDNLTLSLEQESERRKITEAKLDNFFVGMRRLMSTVNFLGDDSSNHRPGSREGTRDALGDQQQPPVADQKKVKPRSLIAPGCEHFIISDDKDATSFTVQPAPGIGQPGTSDSGRQAAAAANCRQIAQQIKKGLQRVQRSRSPEPRSSIMPQDIRNKTEKIVKCQNLSQEVMEKLQRVERSQSPTGPDRPNSLRAYQLVQTIEERLKRVERSRSPEAPIDKTVRCEELAQSVQEGVRRLERSLSPQSSMKGRHWSHECLRDF